MIPLKLAILALARRRVIPIKRVRIRKVMTPTPIASGARERHVALANNHHAAIFAKLDEHGKEVRWDSISVSLYEAMDRKRRKLPVVQRSYPEFAEYQFKFSLMNGDIVEICENGIAQLYRLRSIESNGGFFLLSIRDARLVKDIAKTGDRWRPSADALRKLSCRKVSVDTLGRVIRPMIDRIIEIANPARLSVRDAQLVIERPQSEQLTLPFATPISEIAVLLLAHPQVTLSQAVLSRIAEAGGSVVTIDGHFLPASMQLPVQAHFLQTERFAKQMQLSLPLRKRLWQQIVRAKIRAQGELLKELHGSDAGLIAMSARVRSDDIGNLEAQAARRYWPLLFADTKFRRGAEGPDQNRHLDYGYTVLRAAVARAFAPRNFTPPSACGTRTVTMPFAWPLT